LNALADVVNGQRNSIEILFENKTPKDVVIKTISGVSYQSLPYGTAQLSIDFLGSFSNPKTGITLRNVESLTFCCR